MTARALARARGGGAEQRAYGAWGGATTSQQFIREIGRALGISAFALAATAGRLHVGLLRAGAFACILALPAHSVHGAHQADVR